MAVACLAAFHELAHAQTADTELVEVKTTRGRVRGARTAGLVTFKGIPYAGSVTGANRFKAAPSLPAWTGVRDALQLAAPAPQAGRPASTREPAPAEDYLRDQAGEEYATSGNQGMLDIRDALLAQAAAASLRSGRARHLQEQGVDRRLQPGRDDLLPAT